MTYHTISVTAEELTLIGKCLTRHDEDEHETAEELRLYLGRVLAYEARTGTTT